jgi:hypothetical protein
MQYKVRVPVCGAIILNDRLDKCLLVKGWSSRSGWGFPKGKINKEEEDASCAAREVSWQVGGMIKLGLGQSILQERQINIEPVVCNFEKVDYMKCKL